MMFRAKLAAFAGAMILAGTTFASQELCPELNNIKAEGITAAMGGFMDGFAGYTISDFGTDATWVFVLVPIAAESEEEAIEIGNDILDSMTGPGVLVEPGACQYETGDPEMAAAALKGEFVTPMKLKQFIRR